MKGIIDSQISMDEILNNIPELKELNKKFDIKVVPQKIREKSSFMDYFSSNEIPVSSAKIFVGKKMIGEYKQYMRFGAFFVSTEKKYQIDESLVKSLLDTPV